MEQSEFEGGDENPPIKSYVWPVKATSRRSTNKNRVQNTRSNLTLARNEQQEIILCSHFTPQRSSPCLFYVWKNKRWMTIDNEVVASLAE